MARSLAVQVDSTESDYAEIIGWYQELLERATPPVDLTYEPVRIGPTWQYDNGWVLPEFTLGWRVLAWCGVWLRDKHGNPWQFTAEQARFALWFYAVDPDTSEFAYHSAVLQRCKGWGKDPMAACMSAAALLAEVTPDGWDGEVPIAREEPAAWVQVAAVSQVQTQNTMKLFPSLISPEARKRYGIQVGKLNVWALGDTRQIEAVTASPLAIEGGRPTLIIRNETQNWNASNGGHDMAGAIEGNAAKSEDGAARILDICNAHRAKDGSVGEKVREGWEKTQGDDPEYVDFGLLYDSLEAPPHAPLTLAEVPAVVESVRGDATWLSTRRIVNSVKNPANSASESRRKWYNQTSTAEDARFDAHKVKAAEVAEQLAVGDEVVLFGDGSKSDDATGIVAVRMSDLLAQVLHVQQPGKGQIVDREKLDEAVDDAFATFKVVAFWFDPSHAKDEEATGDDDRFLWPLCDAWAQKYGRLLKLWAVQSGPNRHAVAWDMLTPSHQAQFVAAVGQLDADFNSGTVHYAASGQLRRHLVNAVRHPGRFGVSMRKENRESAKKIDLAVCLAGGRMLARLVQLSRVGANKGAPGKGRVFGLA